MQTYEYRNRRNLRAVKLGILSVWIVGIVMFCFVRPPAQWPLKIWIWAGSTPILLAVALLYLRSLPRVATGMIRMDEEGLRFEAVLRGRFITVSEKWEQIDLDWGENASILTLLLPQGRFSFFPENFFSQELFETFCQELKTYRAKKTLCKELIFNYKGENIYQCADFIWRIRKFALSLYAQKR